LDVRPGDTESGIVLGLLGELLAPGLAARSPDTGGEAEDRTDQPQFIYRRIALTFEQVCRRGDLLFGQMLHDQMLRYREHGRNVAADCFVVIIVKLVVVPLVVVEMIEEVG